jgi:hypothetical protein
LELKNHNRTLLNPARFQRPFLGLLLMLHLDIAASLGQHDSLPTLLPRALQQAIRSEPGRRKSELIDRFLFGLAVDYQSFRSYSF